MLPTAWLPTACSIFRFLKSLGLCICKTVCIWRHVPHWMIASVWEFRPHLWLPFIGYKLFDSILVPPNFGTLHLQKCTFHFGCSVSEDCWLGLGLHWLTTDLFLYQISFFGFSAICRFVHLQGLAFCLRFGVNSLFGLPACFFSFRYNRKRVYNDHTFRRSFFLCFIPAFF